MGKIFLTTITQINFHLEKGESVLFDIEDGFGFFRIENTKNTGLYNNKGIDFFIQTDDGVYLGTPSHDKESNYAELIEEMISEGFEFYVIPGLKFKEV